MFSIVSNEHTIGTTGPDDMYLTSPPKNGLELRSL